MATTNGSAAPEKTIVIVGAGIIGASTAYFLTRHPLFNPSKHRITILEATTIASGASGKAGGLLALWAYPQSLVPLSFRLHKELAEQHGGAERWGYRALNVGSIECAGRKVGTTAVDEQGTTTTAGSSGQGAKSEVEGVHSSDLPGTADGNVARVSLQKRSKESFAKLRKMGVPDDLDWVAEESALGYESMGSTRDTAQVHPYQFTTSMAALAREAGAEVVEHARVTDVTDDDDEGPKTVTYVDGGGAARRIAATDVVLTAGPWTKTVWPAAPVGSLRAHSVVIRPAQPVSAYALFTQIRLPKDFRAGQRSKVMVVTPEIYARPDGTVYACGEGDHLVPLPRTAADVAVDGARCQDIVDYVASVSDELGGGTAEGPPPAVVTARQACYLPVVSVGGGPLVGPTGTKGVWLAAGHTCWGIQNGPGTGRVMSEFVMEGEARSADVRALDPRRVMR